MQIDALLCDYAQIEHKLFVNGAGFTAMTYDAADPGPYEVSFGIAGVVTVPWTETNTEHALRFRILTEDGHAPELSGGRVDEVGGTMTFNVGRPPGLVHGDEQVVPFAFQIASLPRGRTGT